MQAGQSLCHPACVISVASPQQAQCRCVLCHPRMAFPVAANSASRGLSQVITRRNSAKANSSGSAGWRCSVASRNPPNCVSSRASGTQFDRSNANRAAPSSRPSNTAEGSASCKTGWVIGSITKCAGLFICNSGLPRQNKRALAAGSLRAASSAASSVRISPARSSAEPPKVTVSACFIGLSRYRPREVARSKAERNPMGGFARMCPCQRRLDLLEVIASLG